MNQNITKVLSGLLPKIVDLRHELHMYPELANKESLTGKIIRRELESIGLMPTYISNTGLYTILDSGKPGKTIALRAELDGLPIQERNNVPYASKHSGKMHACGHDGHLATLIMIVIAMNTFKSQFKGKIKFIFQPAEETGTGAFSLIDNGILNKPKVDAIFGFHSTHRYAANIFATKAGCLMAGNHNFIIRISGNGGYVSSPNAKNNPINIGMIILQKLEEIKDKIAQSEPIIIVATKFDSGDDNILVPKEASIVGAIRVTTLNTYHKIKQQIINMIDDIVKPFDVNLDIDFMDSLPPLVNTEKEINTLIRAAHNVLVSEKIIDDMHTIMAPEGFACYLQHVPGAFFFIGNGSENGIVHQENYNFNNDIILASAEIMIKTIVEYLNT